MLKKVNEMEKLTECCDVCKREICNNEHRGHIGKKTACAICLDMIDRKNWRKVHGMAN